MITIALTPEQFRCIYLAVLDRVENADCETYDFSSDDFRVDKQQLRVAKATMRLLKRAEQEQAIPF